MTRWRRPFFTADLVAKGSSLPEVRSKARPSAHGMSSLSLSLSSLLTVRNAFTFVSVGYEFVRVAIRRRTSSLEDDSCNFESFQKTEENENKKKKSRIFRSI